MKGWLATIAIVFVAAFSCNWLMQKFAQWQSQTVIQQQAEAISDQAMTIEQEAEAIKEQAIAIQIQAQTIDDQAKIQATQTGMMMENVKSQTNLNNATAEGIRVLLWIFVGLLIFLVFFRPKKKPVEKEIHYVRED